MSLANDIIKRGTRAAQPAAASVTPGALYGITDEGNIIERSTGAAWEAYSPGAGATSVTAASVITDNAIVRGDGGARGTQLSLITISDTGALTLPDNIRQTFNPGVDAAGLNVGAIAGDPGTPSNGDLWYDSTANELTARINGASVALGAGGVGKVIQIVNTQTGAVATGTTTIPPDDTIPQNTEGDEYMTLAITPTSATNKLRIEVAFSCSCSAVAATPIVALFQDTTAGALAATAFTLDNALGLGCIQLFHYMTSGTTSATTFKVRAGPAAAATLTFNGQSGGRLFGGVFASSITITEYVP